MYPGRHTSSRDCSCRKLQDLDVLCGVVCCVVSTTQTPIALFTGPFHGLTSRVGPYSHGAGGILPCLACTTYCSGFVSVLCKLLLYYNFWVSPAMDNGPGVMVGCGSIMNHLNIGLPLSISISLSVTLHHNIGQPFILPPVT